MKAFHGHLVLNVTKKLHFLNRLLPQNNKTGTVVKHLVRRLSVSI